ncbi:hypothetical protein ACOSQ3_009285 [Xanthoceras sorbifolium]
MEVLIQILCSYVILPLYALVTQMGSNMKPAIFNEKVAEALRKWHHTAKKQIKQNKGYHSSPRRSVEWETDSPSPSKHHHHNRGEGSSSSHHNLEQAFSIDHQNNRDVNETGLAQGGAAQQPPVVVPTQHEINIGSKEFSFDKRTSI